MFYHRTPTEHPRYVYDTCVCVAASHWPCLRCTLLCDLPPMRAHTRLLLVSSVGKTTLLDCVTLVKVIVRSLIVDSNHVIDGQARTTVM